MASKFLDRLRGYMEELVMDSRCSQGAGNGRRHHDQGKLSGGSLRAYWHMARWC